MSRRVHRTWGLLVGATLGLLAAGPAWAADEPLVPDSLDAPALAVPAAPVARAPLEALVPDIAAHPYRLEPGVRPYRERIAVSPAWGTFGTERLFALRVAYNPEPWLGYEASIGHNPGHSVHAVIHTFSVLLRRPFPGRLQPYAVAGYGMVIVFPGQALNAAPVTKNALTAGGGLEMYIRSDLAVRGELRQATVFGQQKGREGVVAYGYSQGTLGLSFYRSVRP